MSKPKFTMTKDVQVGIYENCAIIARVYADKIIVTLPYVKWIGNTGGYMERKESIRDEKTIKSVMTELEDDCEETAWGIIGRAIDDEHLSHSGA